MCKRWKGLASSTCLNTSLHINTAHPTLGRTFWGAGVAQFCLLLKRYDVAVLPTKKVRHMLFRDEMVVPSVPSDALYKSSPLLWTLPAAKQLYPNLTKVSLVDISHLTIVHVQELSQFVDTLVLKSVRLYTFIGHDAEPVNCWVPGYRDVGIEIKDWCTLVQQRFWEPIWRFLTTWLFRLLLRRRNKCWRLLKPQTWMTWNLQ